MYVRDALLVIITTLALDYVAPQRMIGPPPTVIPLQFCFETDDCTLPLEYCHLFCAPSMTRAKRSLCNPGGNCRRYLTYGDRCSNLTPLCAPPLTCEASGSFYKYNIGTCQHKRCKTDEECGPKEACVHNNGMVTLGTCILEDTSTMKPGSRSGKCKWTCTD